MNKLVISSVFISFLIFFTNCQKEEESKINTPPVGSFEVNPPTGTTATVFKFDASGCSDFEDNNNNLQVRWSWFGDGYWDTEWSYYLSDSMQFNDARTYTVTLEVKDSEGLTNVTSKEIIIEEEPNTFIDPRDGRRYRFVEIGNQTWMAENLDYNMSNSWWYDNSTANAEIYGRLYIWDAAMAACPPDWHLPSDAEWSQLTNYLGGESVAGGKMKESGVSHWLSPNVGATNSSGFNALPAGHVIVPENYANLGWEVNWWSSTERNSMDAWLIHIDNNKASVLRTSHPKTALGFSVRCIKD